jgi:methylthioribose-1-phosphate isomerase
MITVFWYSDGIKLIDQRCIPTPLEIVTLHSYMEIINSIRNMTVQGAPAIGALTAFGLALATNTSNSLSAEDFIFNPTK